MGILRQLFGPSRDEVWEELCRQIKADYVDGGFWKGEKVQVHFKEWTITLDTYSSSSENSTTTYTRIRAPYVNADNFRFTIYQASIFSGIATFFGMQDIVIGERWFDSNFVIQGNDEEKVLRFLSNKRVRELIRNEPEIWMTVKDDEGYFSGFPDHVDELYLEFAEDIRDIDRLKALFELFAESLNMLCHMGSAYEDDPCLDL